MTIQLNANMVDRFVRIILGGACMLSASYIPMPTLAILALMVIGLYLMFSGLAGQCLIYRMLGINTCK